MGGPELGFETVSLGQDAESNPEFRFPLAGGEDGVGIRDWRLRPGIALGDWACPERLEEDGRVCGC